VCLIIPLSQRIVTGRFRQSDLLRRLFETVLRRCINEGLVGGEGFAVDAGLIKAEANRQKGIEGAKGLPPEAAGRAVEEYLAVLDDAAFGGSSPQLTKGAPCFSWKQGDFQEQQGGD